MAVKPEEIVKALGLEVDNIDELDIASFNEKLLTKFVPLEGIEKNETVRTKLVGKVLGSAGTKTAQLFGLEKSEYDGKPLEEIVQIGKAKLDKQLTDAQELAKAGFDENGKKLAKKLDETTEKLTLATKGLTDWEQKYNTDIAEKDNGLKAYKLNDKVSKIKADKVNPLLNEDYHKNKLIQTGFDKSFNDTYLVDLDEEENVVVRSKADNKIVISKVNTGKPAGIDEVLLQEAEAAGIVKKNNAGGNKPVFKTKLTEENKQGEVKIHPNAQKRAQGAQRV